MELDRKGTKLIVGLIGNVSVESTLLHIPAYERSDDAVEDNGAGHLDPDHSIFSVLPTPVSQFCACPETVEIVKI